MYTYITKVTALWQLGGQQCQNGCHGRTCKYHVVALCMFLTLQRFNANKPLMLRACSNNGWPVPDNTEDETGKIWDAVNLAARQTGVDHRFIFAIMLQESNGCVRVWATDGGVHNPGLMQSHNGEHHCNSGTSPNLGSILSPCPPKQINGMIMDGVGGTASGDGLSALLNRAVRLTNSNGADARAFYLAARMYNSGSTSSVALEKPSAGTRCYVTDVANRLTGWVRAPSLCRNL